MKEINRKIEPNLKSEILIVCGSEAAASTRIIQIADRVDYARKVKEENNLSNCRSLREVLDCFPLTDKTMLASLGHKACCSDWSKTLLFSETSGTTGQPLSTPRGADEFKWNAYNQAYAYLRHLQPGIDRVAILHPSVMSPFVEVSAKALQDVGVGYLRVFPIPEVCDYSRILKILSDHKITAIMSTPSLVCKLLYEAHSLDIPIPSSINKVLLTGELLTSAYLKNIDSLFGKKNIAQAFVYGSSEVATVMYGDEDSNYIPFINDFVYEIIPKNKIPLDELKANESLSGIEGELVVTWLRDGMMPIIRYKTGDIFRVYQAKEKDKWVFKPVGRKSSVLDESIKQKIEEVIYELSVSVFHYEVIVSDNYMTIILIVNKKLDSNEKSSLSDKILQFGHSIFENVKIKINPVDHEFYRFSIRPKLTKYRSELNAK